MTEAARSAARQPRRRPPATADTAAGAELRHAATGTLHVRGLTVARGSASSSSDVTIDVPPGEVTALLGPNGAGKSSLVLALGGVLRPAAGSVALDERELTRKRPEAIRQAGLAIVPEGRRLLPAAHGRGQSPVATYTMSREDAEAGRERALDTVPRAAQAAQLAGAAALRRRAADGRARAGARQPPEGRA